MRSVIPRPLVRSFALAVTLPAVLVGLSSVSLAEAPGAERGERTQIPLALHSDGAFRSPSSNTTGEMVSITESLSAIGGARATVDSTGERT